MELMIIVVVATIGTAMVVGWMGNVEEPNTIGDISSNTNQITMSTDTYKVSQLTFTVFDSHGDVVPDAVVTLSGCGVYTSNNLTTPMAVTNSLGVATFFGLTLVKSTPGVSYLNVTASTQDLGETYIKIPVVR
ncbi:MAG: hypothetical protein MJZ38_02765 [archaeon]|nr:hypothetical protein [archaeon]